MSSNPEEDISLALKGTMTKLRKFDRSVELLCKNENLASEYPNEWIAVYEGKIQAHKRKLETLLKELDSHSIPRNETVIRFIEKEPRMLILHAPW